MQQEKNFDYPTNALGRFWMKVPLIVRSILIGLCVSSIGVWSWVALVSIIPTPWSVVVMGGALIIYLRYFSGRWAPASTQAFRGFCIRRFQLKGSVWLWGVLAALSIVLMLHWGFSLTFRIYEFQPDVFKTARYLNDFPAWKAWPIIIMASMVAGVCEEVGFRGFMQAPLEKKYGPFVGISITSLVFVVVHLHQAWASGVLLGIFLVSFVLGYLAYATKSLIPGILAHVSFDIINFSYWWSDVMGNFEYQTIDTTGFDAHFFVSLGLVLLSIVILFATIRKLLRLKVSAEGT